MNELNRRQEALIDTTLGDYPLAPLPLDFAEQVMARIDAAQPAPTAIRFKLQFLDIALSLFLAIFVSLSLVLGLWLTGILDIVWLPNFQLNLAVTSLLNQGDLAWWRIGGALIVGEFVLAILVCVNLWGDRPYSRPINQ